MKNLRFFLLSLILLLTGINSFAQVGFDNPNPDSSALIDMKANDKGLLIPRMTTVDRTNMTKGGKTPAHALMVFDVDQNMFFVYDTITEPDRWIALNPFQAPSNAGDITTPITGKVGIGLPNPSEKLEVKGNIKSSNNIIATGNLNASNANLSGSLSSNSVATGNVTSTGTVTATKFVGDGIIPKGGIIMWSGSTVPVGWAICDGNNGTPDLRGRFVVGTGTYTESSGTFTYTNGSKGGEAKHQLTIAEMPNHNHTNGTFKRLVQLQDESTELNKTASGGLDTSLGEVNIVNAAFMLPAGGDQPHENRPPYYALAYIMKL